MLQENTTWVSACPDYLVQVYPACNNKFLRDVSSMEVTVVTSSGPSDITSGETTGEAGCAGCSRSAAVVAGCLAREPLKSATTSRASSLTALVSRGLLPAYELIPLHAVLLSHDQSLAQDQVTSPVGRPLEKLGELAAPEVQLLLLAA